MKPLILSLAGLVTLVGVTAAAWAALKPGHRATSDERRLADILNDTRGQAMLAAFNVDPALNRVARANAQRLAGQGMLNFPSQKSMHDQLQAAGYPSAVWSMNIDAMDGLDVDALVQNWTNTYATRGEMFQRKYEDCGVGIAQDAGGKYYFTVVFGTKRK